MIIDVISDHPLVAELVSQLVKRAPFDVHAGTVTRDWGAFITTWNGVSNLVILKAELHDHVPAALKVRAFSRMHVATIVVCDYPREVHDARLLDAGAAAVAYRSDGLKPLGDRATKLLTSAPQVPRIKRRDDDLSDREMQIACAYASRDAPSTTTIAGALQLSPETVRAHLSRARRRLTQQNFDTSNRASLRSALISTGWLFQEL